MFVEAAEEGRGKIDELRMICGLAEWGRVGG